MGAILASVQVKATLRMVFKGRKAMSRGNETKKGLSLFSRQRDPGLIQGFRMHGKHRRSLSPLSSRLLINSHETNVGLVLWALSQLLPLIYTVGKKNIIIDEMAITVIHSQPHQLGSRVGVTEAWHGVTGCLLDTSISRVLPATHASVPPQQSPSPDHAALSFRSTQENESCVVYVF